MARKIKGRIKDSKTGNGILGLNVQGWDDDWPDNDDFMGQSLTNSNGDYLIDYTKSGDSQHWDPSLGHGDTRWRPDIYIRILIRTHRNRWVKLWKSSVFNNHPLRDDLTINKTLTIEAAISKNTTFNPLVHGFKFPNKFRGTFDILGIPISSNSMGLCGGMCGGVLNRYKNNIPIPPDTTPPNDGTSLFNELMTRQIISLNGIIDDIIVWQNSPDESHAQTLHSVGYRTREQWLKLKTEIDNGRPTPIIIITQEGATSNYFDNHQVLVMGYKFEPTTKDVWIDVYDPNHPNQTPQIYMNVGLPNCKLDTTYTHSISGGRVRGFFINPNKTSMSANR
jgi:hypothetical protein